MRSSGISPRQLETNESQRQRRIKMKRYQHRVQRKLSLTWLLAFTLPVLPLINPSLSAPQKMTAEEVVARHLESIGSAKARAAVTSRIIAGTSQVIFRSPPPGQ